VRSPAKLPFDPSSRVVNQGINYNIEPRERDRIPGCRNLVCRRSGTSLTLISNSYSISFLLNLTHTTEISVRHQLFAMRAVWECVPRGIKALGFPGIVAAYIKTYNPRSYGGRVLVRPV
jgi:hypothetical protein